MTAFPQDSKKPKRIARIDVRGEAPALWSDLRGRLLARIQQALDTTLDHNRGTTLREEAQAFTSHMLDYARQRLQREGLESDKIEAQVAEIYARRTKELAEAELVSAEAQSQHQQNTLQELCTTFALTKAYLVGEEGKEALLFGQQISAFLETVKDLSLFK